jgi:hypothetical protein
MRVNNLKDSLPKVLLFKTFDESVCVMEFVTSRSGKPSCSTLFHILDMAKRPVVSMTTYVQVGVSLKPSHLCLRVKSVPLGVTRHIVSRVYSALSSIWEVNPDLSFPILSYGVRPSNPFQRVTSTTPHVMIAANQNERVHLAYKPLN